MAWQSLYGHWPHFLPSWVYATLAHSAERHIRNVQVPGSNPGGGSVCYDRKVAPDQVILSLAAAWCLNLSVAYFATTVILPIFRGQCAPLHIDQELTTQTISYAVALFLIAVILELL